MGKATIRAYQRSFRRKISATSRSVEVSPLCAKESLRHSCESLRYKIGPIGSERLKLVCKLSVFFQRNTEGNRHFSIFLLRCLCLAHYPPVACTFSTAAPDQNR